MAYAAKLEDLSKSKDGPAFILDRSHPSTWQEYGNNGECVATMKRMPRV